MDFSGFQQQISDPSRVTGPQWGAGLGRATNAGAWANQGQPWGQQMPWSQQSGTTNGSTSTGTGAWGQAQDARNKAFQLGQDQLTGLQNDPIDKSVQSALMGRISGQNVPYSQQVQSAQLSKASDMSAQGMAQNVANLRGNPGDPAYQAQINALNSQRQQSNQGAQQNINMNANLQNYNAIGNAIGQGAQTEGMYQSQLGAARGNLQDMNWTSQFTQQSPYGGPSFGQYQSQMGQGGGSNLNYDPFGGGGSGELGGGYQSGGLSGSVWAGSPSPQATPFDFSGFGSQPAQPSASQDVGWGNQSYNTSGNFAQPYSPTSQPGAGSAWSQGWTDPSRMVNQGMSDNSGYQTQGPSTQKFTPLNPWANMAPQKQQNPGYNISNFIQPSPYGAQG